MIKTLSLSRTFNNFSVFLYILFIASLPFFSIRPGVLPFSIPLIILLLISLQVIINLAINTRYKIRHTFFDVLLLVYVSIASISYLASTEGNNMVLIKTIVYFSCYILLKQLLLSMDKKLVIKTTVYGIITGTFSYILVILYVISISGGLLSIFSDLSYFGFTSKIYQAIAVHLLANDDFVGANIMRNSLGEAFAFYFIFLLLTIKNTSSKSRDLVILLANFGLTIFSFSRRAFLAIAISLFLSNIRGGLFLKIINFFIFIIAIYLFVFVFSGESRLTSFEDNVRTTQYAQTLEKVSENFLTGYGYGAKIGHITDMKYVHNFILASGYMMGIIGFIISISIFMYTLVHYILPILKNEALGYSYLLVIPIFGMGVGATVEGMFTLTSWLVYALHAATRDA